MGKDSGAGERGSERKSERKGEGEGEGAEGFSARMGARGRHGQSKRKREREAEDDGLRVMKCDQDRKPHTSADGEGKEEEEGY